MLETDFFRYSLTNVNPDPAWVSLGFDDSSWGVGQGGFGYGDGDDNTLVQGNGTLYLRTTFNVANPDEWDSMTWAMDVDDGYIAYLNGEEFARSDNMIGVGGNATDFTIGYTDALLITEACRRFCHGIWATTMGPTSSKGTMFSPFKCTTRMPPHRI